MTNPASNLKNSSGIFGLPALAPMFSQLFGGAMPGANGGVTDPAAIVAMTKQQLAGEKDAARMRRPDPFSMPSATNTLNPSNPYSSTALVGATGVFGVAGRKPGGLMGA